MDIFQKILDADLVAQIIVGVLAFFGAYLGTKRIKRHLIDNYIEGRVTKALETNDKVLNRIRTILSDFEQEYEINRAISDDELDSVIDQCRELSNLSSDGGKEVSTIAYLLYQIVQDVKPSYESNAKEGRSLEKISTGSFIGLVDRSLRLIIEYCETSTPIPFKTRLMKRSNIKRGLRKYLTDKRYYSLKHHPFGLTLNPNSEVVLRFSSVIGFISIPLFRKNLFMFLQSNLPIVYELLVSKVYMPPVLAKKDEFDFFGKQELHLVKIQPVKAAGADEGDYIDFFYANIGPRVKFVDGISNEKLISEFVHDGFINEYFPIKGCHGLVRKTNEIIKIRIDAKTAKRNFRRKEWRLRYVLLRKRFRH